MSVQALVGLLRADLARLFPSGAGRPSLGWVHPRFLPVLLLRLSAFFWGKPGGRVFSGACSLLNVVFFGLEATPRCDIGPGLLIPHPVGVVIGANKIGRNATIMQGVTLGAKFVDIGFDPAARPVLGDDVMVGAGAKVLGGIGVGSGARIAANSLVTRSVPERAIVAGVPARAWGGE